MEDRPYAVETANGKHFKTTQYLRAAHGKAERNWPFITCSDSPFTEVCFPEIYARSHNTDPSRPNGIGTSRPALRRGLLSPPNRS